ncbi:MAG TPA: sugar phosphate isomerase/epimerase family protein [Flavisolibacter sp.]
MKHLTRKEFIQTASLLAASLASEPILNLAKKSALLSFSTLGCPDWSFEQITDFAVKHGYKGLEIRGLQREMDLTKSPEFRTDTTRRATVKMMKQKGLKFVGLGSSANLHLPEGAERDKNLAEAKSFIDLAGQIGCPYVRVFPNNYSKDETKATVQARIAKGLLQLGDHAKGKGVTVLMETHGDVVWIEDIAAIMSAADHKQVGLLWDVSNMWSVTKESPKEAYAQLKKHIRHIHVKDAKIAEGKLAYTLLGKGDVPIFEAIDALADGGYKGFYSFEWEKLWHPEIEAPEIALAHFPGAMKEHMKP